MIKISIIIPIYNVAQYIIRCLDSVAKQTYKGEIECILVDDCSPDNSAELCEEFLKKYKGNISFVLIKREKNGGLSDARNAGTEIAKGDFIYYLDSDDELPLSAISILVSTLNKYPNADIVIGKMLAIPDKDMYKNPRFDDITFVNDNTWVRKNFCRLSNRIPVNACNKLIRKSFLIENNLFFKKGLIHEDELWMFQVSQILEKLAFVNEITYLRYINPGSITTGTSTLKKRHAWSVILKEIFSHIDQPAFFEQFQTYYEKLNQSKPFANHAVIQLNKIVWEEVIRCASRNNHQVLAHAVKIHVFLSPVLKGHVTGLIIWIIFRTLCKSEYKIFD